MARVMIVDDETELLALYSEMLTVFGHEIIAAVTNGEEAIKKYEELKTKPDLIILDHRMPIRNGLETAAEILSQDPDEKIIFISADSSIRKAALDIGAIDFLEKPFVLKSLRDSVQRALSA
ncbi:MAG TPA: response regulator [Euryarchaeota archaeon]|nr:MAG: two-component system response regulator [Thermoplasmatales archaeon ex4484_6]HHD15400.1 response regulator [Euryarchaeota archaeon]